MEVVAKLHIEHTWKRKRRLKTQTAFVCKSKEELRKQLDLLAKDVSFKNISCDELIEVQDEMGPLRYTTNWFGGFGYSDSCRYRIMVMLKDEEGFATLEDLEE